MLGKLIGRISRERGAVLVISAVLLVCVLALGMGMLTNAYLNSNMAGNHRERMLSFCAADGLMTKLAQEVIDGRGALYVRNPKYTGVKIGTFTGTGGDTVRADTQRVWGGGVGVTGTSDGLRFEYTRVSGDFDVSMDPDSIRDSVGSAAKRGVGIMARVSTAVNAQCVLWELRPDSAIRVVRSTSGGTAVKKRYTYKIGYPIRLERVRNRFSTYVDAGVGWKQLDTVTVATMPETLLVGVAVHGTSTSTMAKAKVVCTRGVPRVDTVTVGTYSVRSDMVVGWDGMFRIATMAYKQSGSDMLFTTALNQMVAPSTGAGYRSVVEDSVYVPITLYDFHADGSNPEFQVVGLMSTYLKNMVWKDSLTPDRKPISSYDIASVNKAFRNCLLTTNACATYGPSRWNNIATNWWRPCCCYYTAATFCGWVDATTCNTCKNTWLPSPARKGCEDQVGASDRNWFFSDSITLWFRPSGAPGATFDTNTGRWNGLLYDNTRKAWYGPDMPAIRASAMSWRDTAFADMVVYDTLMWVRDTTLNPADKNTYVYGKTCDTSCFTFCGSPPSPWTDSASKYFHPLKERGFGYDGPWDSVKSGVGYYRGQAYTSWPAVYKKQNYAYTMEMHRKFVADTGQIFTFRGNDDLWVFVQGNPGRGDSLVMDDGGIHVAVTDTLRIKPLIQNGFLTRGEAYWFDLFYTERNGWGAEILMATNIMWYDPGRPTQRRWKRDYGNLD